jgi:hypothetical protein
MDDRERLVGGYRQRRARVRMSQAPRDELCLTTAEG